MLETTVAPIVLRGRVVQPDGTAPERYLLIRGGEIRSITRRRPPHTDDALYLETGFQDWIFPGLLDLHTHTSYNLLPIWNGPNFPYRNRFAWRRDEPDYGLHISRMMAYLHEPHGQAEEPEAEKSRAKRKKAHLKSLAAFSELQAVAGGTTTLQESKSLEEEAELTGNVLCRSTGRAAELGLGAGDILSPIDFFSPDGNDRPQVKAWGQWVPIEDYARGRDEGRVLATLLHLAEGRSGFGGAEPDPYSRAEFEAFMEHPAMSDPAKVRSSPFAIIHGCGIDVDDPEHLDFLREREISVVWSPVSNLLLYGQTLDVEKLVHAGINVALGSDWSPSGSKHIWEEAKFARFYFEALGSTVSDAQVYQMVSVNAAACLRAAKLGRLAVGAFADLFILRSPLESDNPLEVFFKTTDRDVRAVFVGGVPVYGERSFLAGFEEEPFHLRLQGLPEREGSSVVGKAVHLPAELTNEEGLPLDLDRDIDHLEDLMKEAPPPLERTLRSNLLVSSDVHYRENMAQLRARTIDYGWRIQQWRRERAKQGRSRS